MKGSTRIGRFAGIGVYIHWTFWLLIGWILYIQLSSGHGLAVALEGVAFVAAIFACVVLHEFGHALTAKRFGVHTRDITLLPIGGVARLEHIPEDPRQELLIAIAGPAVNVVIAAVLFLVIAFVRGIPSVAGYQLLTGDFLARLMFVNIALVVFNMIPAFPMDGGRVLRALLARRMNYVRATQMAARVGQAFAVLFAVLGFFTNWLLLFIAVFVYLGAIQESRIVQLRATTREIPVCDAMMTRFQVLDESDDIRGAARVLLAGVQRDFPVTANGKLTGILTHDDLMHALTNGQSDQLIGDVMHHKYRSVDESDMLDESFLTLRNGECPCVPVIRNGKLVGLITFDNIAEWIAVQSTVSGERSHSRIESHTIGHGGISPT